MIKRWFLVILLLLPLQFLKAQITNRLDSLKSKLASEKSDTGRVILNYSISFELQFSDVSSASEYAQKAYDEAVKIKYKKGIGHALIQFGNIEQTKGNFSEADKYYNDALKILLNTSDRAGVAVCYNNLGILAHNRNDYPAALKLYSKALEINKSVGKQSGTATSLFCIGTVYENQSKYDSALIYYLEADGISQKINDKRLMAIAKTTLGNVYFNMANYRMSKQYYEEAVDLYVKSENILGLLKVFRSLGQISENQDSLIKAEWYYRQALKISYRLSSPNDIAGNLFSLGQLYENVSMTDSAYSNYSRALNIYNENGNRENKAFSLIALARVENQKEKHLKAVEKLEEALKLAKEIGSSRVMISAYQELAITYSEMKDFKTAFLLLNRFSDVKDSVMNVEKQKQILELQTQYETDKKEKENVILRKDRKILETTRNSLIIGSLLLIIIVFTIFRSLSIKKRDNILLKKQKEEIRQQKEIVEAQKLSITDSIRYAKRIQGAMLPPDESVNEFFPESFILYLPRDIVSGDFYWLRKISENISIVCVADCTGHGVPGAMMSMLGMSLLNEIVNSNFSKILQMKYLPADILNEMRSRIKSSLRQTGREGEARDGMDMSLCMIDRDKGHLYYSGANNSIYMVENGILTELKPTRNPIGIYLNETLFVNQEQALSKNSTLFLFSDGFSDQIGQEGKKFLSKNFKSLLSETDVLTMVEIKEKLHEAHLKWRGSEEQVDDILVIGLRT